ncbi:GNAT family N-acetyltransferase [Candidatus Roizmanbacteria bacterium]|nr:GNAT family N-acetyltransferase [Candidatus Roizmanbacteria bacterium]
MIIFSGNTKEGKPYVIRNLEAGDTEAMMRYINKLSLEQTYILRQGEQSTYEEEKKFVDDQLKQMKDGKALYLVIESENCIIGATQINLKEKVHSHVGHLGISLALSYRDQGLGAKLLGVVIERSKIELPSMKIIDLSVFAINDRAKHLYEKFGFKEFGRLPKGVFYKGEYVDHIYMHRDVIMSST